MISIEDLDFINPQASTSTALLGGINTEVNASVFTGYNFAAGNVSSYAFGQQTLTFAGVSTKITNTSFSSNSSVEADGTAVAKSETQYSRTSIKISSSSTYIDYSN
ncbi:MAG: hypothetical protein KME43_17160 [Myxacorys chilensis ATA2-1-KO14]|jgi:hypothetical protein|nr:hypothetical protein [Myxacorys chilensis ATA2-1-KO14]